MICHSGHDTRVHGEQSRTLTVLHVAYGLNGTGAVATRAREDILATADLGHTNVAATERLNRPLPGPRATFHGGFHGLAFALPGSLGEALSLPVVWHAMNRAAGEFQLDVIVFHNSTLAMPVLKLAEASGARTVFVVHALVRDRIANDANPYGPLTTTLYSRCNRQALRGSHRTIAVSEHIAQVAIAEGARPDRVSVVPNPIDLDRFTANPHVSRDIDVLFVGRLSIEKGVDVLIEALNRLPNPVRVVIAGEGPLRSTLETLASTGRNFVEFRGWVPASEVADLTRRSHVQVVPSRSEPQGVVALEALASGTPVIATATGGLPDMIRHGENGWLVQPQNVSELLTTLTQALDDRSHVDEMRVRARDSVLSFGRDRHASRIGRAYFG